MPFSVPPHTPYQWQDAPSQGTPLDKAHLEAAEQDLVGYTQQAVNAYDAFAESQFITQIPSSVESGVSKMLMPSGGDDSAALASALTSFAPFVSPVVKLGPGTFQWNTSVPSLLRATAAKIIGSGWNQTYVKLSSTAPRFLDCPYVADYDTYQDIEISDLTVDCNNITKASNRHVVVGNLISGAWSQRANVSHVRIRRVRTINVPNKTTGGGAVCHSVSFGSKHVSAGEGTQTSLTDIVCEDCEFNGGDYGFTVVGTSSTGGVTSVNVFMDRNGVDGLKHDLGATPTTSLSGNSAHVQIGGLGFGERAFIKRLVGNNSTDVGTEIDGHMSADFEDCEITDALNAAHGSYNFQQPRDPYSQVHTYHKCRVRMVNLDGLNVGTFIGWECGSPNTPAVGWFGTVVLDDCAYDSVAPNWQSNGIVVSCRGAGLRRIVFGKMQVNLGSVNQTLTGNTTASLFFIDPTSVVPCNLEGDGPIDVRVNGTTNLSGHTFTANPFFVQGQPNSDITLGIRNYRPDYNMSGVGAGTTHLALLGPSTQYTTTVSGTTDGTTAVVTGTNTTSLTLGQLVTGTGIRTDSYIKSIDSGTQFTMTKTSNAAGTNTLTVTQCPGFRGEFHYQVRNFAGGDTNPYGVLVQPFTGAATVNNPMIRLMSDLSFPYCDASQMPNSTPGTETGREVFANPQAGNNGSGQFAVLFPGMKIAGNSPPTARTIGSISSSPTTFTNLQFGRRIKFWLTGTGTITAIGFARRSDNSPITVPGLTSYGPYELDCGDSIQITATTPAFTMNVIPSRT